MLLTDAAPSVSSGGGADLLLEALAEASSGAAAVLLLEQLAAASSGPGAFALLETLRAEFAGPSADLTLLIPPATAGPSAEMTFVIEIGILNLAATVINAGCIELTWDDVGDTEDGYRIERRKQGDIEWIEIGSVGADTTLFLDEFAVPLITYEYRVFSFEDDVDTHPSHVVTAVSPLPPDMFVGPPPVTPVDPPRNAIKIDPISFDSPGAYGLERDQDGNVTGFKY